MGITEVTIPLSHLVSTMSQSYDGCWFKDVCTDCLCFGPGSGWILAVSPPQFCFNRNQRHQPIPAPACRFPGIPAHGGQGSRPGARVLVIGHSGYGVLVQLPVAVDLL